MYIPAQSQPVNAYQNYIPKTRLNRDTRPCLIKMEERSTVGKTAVIDIDNTLWQFSDALYLELKKINDNCPTPDKWNIFNIWEGCCSFEDFIAVINTYPTRNHKTSCRH